MIDEMALTTAMLDRFHAGLRAAGAPLAEGVQRGFTDAEVDALAGDLGVAIPPELRTLWRWGVAPAMDAFWDPARWGVAPDNQLWPPSIASEQTQVYSVREDASKGVIGFAGIRGNTWLLIDGDTESPTSQVSLAFSDDAGTTLVAPSLGALFTHWADHLTDATYYIDDNGHWRRVNNAPKYPIWETP